MSTQIARIETFLFRAEVSEPVKTSFGSIPRRSVLLLRVEDNDGASGWGEIWCNFPAYSSNNKAYLVETVIAPAALGMEFEDPRDVWHTLTEKTRRWAIQSGEYGPISACLAGLDLALWDLTGRRKGLPLSTLLGAAADKRAVPAYASGLNPDTALETVRRARSAGFTAFKVKVAFGLKQDLAILDSINQDLRPGERLMVDANQGWDMSDARKAIGKMSERNLGWIEEPIPADSPTEHWAELAMLSASAIAGGENVSGFGAFSKLINEGSHKVVQPDLLKWGGVTGCFAVGRQAVAKGLTYCPHWLGSAIGLTASAHLLAAVGGNGLLEHDVMENPLREAFTSQFPRVANGVFPLPQGPGLGFVPDLEKASQWLLSKAEFTK
jgi:L-alanine-DL-glutamate epimerase-like enolase superfamily enzyme